MIEVQTLGEAQGIHVAAHRVEIRRAAKQYGKWHTGKEYIIGFVPYSSMPKSGEVFRILITQLSGKSDVGWSRFSNITKVVYEEDYIYFNTKQHTYRLKFLSKGN